MKTNNKFYSTRTYSLKKDHNILNISNLKLINKPKIYHPINPSHPFNIDLLNLKEISKRKNALLINNKPLKDKILKFSLDLKKNSNENHDPNKYYFNQFKDEEKNYQLTIRAILKKDIDNFPLYLSERKSNKKKKKKINLKTNFSRNDTDLNSNLLRFYTSFSHTNSKNTKNPETPNIKGISGYASKNKKLKHMKINKLNLQSLGIKLSPKKRKLNLMKMKILDNLENKTVIIKRQLSFTATNLKSAKLGKISIYGVFEEIGVHGKIICTTLINYLIDYFKSSKEMNVCIEKNNFYSILHWSFINAQNYLINNQEKLDIDLSYSGCMACFLFFPKNIGNKIYCADSGNCKCLLYTNRGPDIFAFSMSIDRPSERDRIYKFLRDKKLTEILNSMKEKEALEKKNNAKKDNKKDNKKMKIKNDDQSKENSIEENEKEMEKEIEKNNNDNKEETKQNIKEEEKITINEEELQNEHDKSIKYLKEIGFTRCFGLISAGNYGMTPDPEINECDLKSSKVKYTVLGNYTFWRILTEPEIRHITSKYAASKDTAGANKELWDLIRQKVGYNAKILERCGYEVIYFDNFL